MTLRAAFVWTMLAPACLCAADPTFLRRSLSAIQPRPDDLTAGASGAVYRPLFGAGDADARQLKGIARYGELTVQPEGASATVNYPAEEQIYFILAGEATLLYGSEKIPLRRHDFLYLPVGVKHGVANSTAAPVRLLVMGFKIPRGVRVAPTPGLMLANADGVEAVPLAGHGPTSLFKLLMGTTASTRDRLAAASQMVSLCFSWNSRRAVPTSRITTKPKRRSTSCSRAAEIWLPAGGRTATKDAIRQKRATPTFSA
jgi:hypothetical protein